MPGGCIVFFINVDVDHWAEVSENNISVMIRSVVRFHHWPPNVIDDLFLDNVDDRGLEYWYHDTIKYSEEISNSGANNNKS